MNLAQFRTAFYANCPQTQTTIVAKALKSSDNWASVMRDNGQKDVIIFHFEGRTFADFLAYFEKSAFYFCDSIEIETRTRAGHLEVFVYALKGLLSLARAKQNDHKRAQAAQEAAELDQQQAEYEAARAENEAEGVAQSAQQSDANAPQIIDVSADITYTTLGINAKQALVLGETTAEQMQDNAPQEDAEISEPLVKLAHPQVLTNSQIAEFFEQYEKSTNGHYTVSLGGHFWNIGITAVPNTRKTVSITGLYSSNGINGSTVIVGRKDNYTLALRYIYECIYKRIQKITQALDIEPITPSKGIHAIGNSMQEQADLELILAREIPCTCVGLSGEVLTDARLIWDYNPKLEQITYQAFKETSEGLFHIENVYWVIPQTPIQVLWQMQAELTRQANLIKKSEQ